MTQAPDIVCPDCHGRKLVSGHVCGGPRAGWRDDLNCSTCQGTGVVDAEYPERRAAGQMARSLRVAAGESLFAAAKRLGMKSSELSALEMGRKPRP